MILRRFLTLTILVSSLHSIGVGQGGENTPDYSSLLPRIPPRSPVDSMAVMQLKPGYQVELVACEPIVLDPVAIAFDEAARMYVVEMCDYSEQATERLGNVRLLEDKDYDGLYETSTYFASGLSWPTAIACYDGGVFVGAAPDILYLKDTNADGKADVQRVVFTGFGRSNVQGLLNSFCWGLDNRLYGQTSSSGGMITSPENPTLQPLNLGGRDFSFDPELLDLRSEGGGGQHGMSFDDWGNRFTCHNSDNLQFHLYDYRYQSTQSAIALPPARQSIAVDGPQAPVYRISEVEPWRILRTNLRVAKQVAGIVEGGGRPSGYFTSATGVTIYRGDNMPDLLGMAFIGDVGSNIVHRKRLTPNGISWQGNRIDNESEFLASQDIWFRPVQFANGPDGCLYILDLYREVIEHPMSLPQDIKKHLDLTSGRDRGRIYRVRLSDAPIRRNNDLSRLSRQELVKLLIHPNSWHRETASRLLAHSTKRDDPSIRELLHQIEQLSKTEQGRAGGLECLSLIARWSSQRTSDLTPWFFHPDAPVRRASLELIEPLAVKDPSIRSSLYKLASDPSLAVRFQLALSLSTFPMNEDERAIRAEAARELLMSAQGDQAMIAAAGNLSIPFLGDVVQSIVSRDGNDDQSLDFYVTIGKCFGLTASEEALKGLDESLTSTQSTAPLQAMLAGTLEGIAARYKSDIKRLENLPSIRSEIFKRVDESKRVIAAQSSSDTNLAAAISILKWDRKPETVQLLTTLLTPTQSAQTQSLTLDVISEFDDGAAAESLIDRYRLLSPNLRGRVADLLIQRRPWLDVLMSRAGQGSFDLNELAPAQQASLQNHPDKKIQEQAARILGKKNSDRQELLEKYRAALDLKGDVEKGRAAFERACAACHRLENVGYELGPNLATFRYRGAAAILENVIDPNREVNPQYLNYVIRTKDERTITGMIDSETASEIKLNRGLNAQDVVARNDIDEMKSSKVSVMPEGLENQLDIQSMADLLAYLLQVR